MNLTYRYSVIQFTHWASSTGAAAFATTYLLNKGVPSGIVGSLLAMAGLCSCLLQPVLASFADRAEKFVLTQMLLIISALCSVCFVLQLLPGVPVMLVAVFYMLVIWSSDVLVPLLNAVSVAYNNAGYSVDYGAARGIGAVASAVSSLIIGWVIARFGTTWMLVLLLAARLGSMIALAGFPKIPQTGTSDREDEKGLSIRAFFGQYHWYCLSLLGIAFLGMYHAMTENYMIVIMKALGCSAGNFAGGQLLNLGVSAILLAGIVMTVAGTLLTFATVTKNDSCL